MALTPQMLRQIRDYMLDTCVWRFDDGQYIASCDLDKFINISPNGMKYCPYCGRQIHRHASKPKSEQP